MPAGAINPFSDTPTKDTETVFRKPFTPGVLSEIGSFGGLFTLEPDNPRGARDDGRTNLFAKAGFQWGTEEDDFGNRISGDPNDRVRNLFTMSRTFGPGGRGVSLGLTWGVPVADYQYLRLEGEAVTRCTNSPSRMPGMVTCFVTRSRCCRKSSPIKSTDVFNPNI